MIRRTTQSVIDNYFLSESVSQSKLKRLARGIEVYNSKDEKKLYYEEKGHFVIGNGVDVWLTQGANNFEEQFFKMEAKKPSPVMMSIVQQILDIVSIDKPSREIHMMNMDLNVSRELILQVATAHEYQSRYGDDAKEKAVRKEGSDYFQALAQGHGQQICSEDEWMLIHEIVTSLQESPLTGDFFDEDMFMGDGDYDIFYQYPIYFKYRGVECKALFDFIIVNHATKTITPYDIKTFGDYTINFMQGIMRRRYDIQAAFYLEALKKDIVGLSVASGKDLSQYRIGNFYFVVESTTSVGNPLIYKADAELISMGTYGRREITIPKNITSDASLPYIRHNEILGFSQMIDLYIWHMENGFEKDRIVKENDGVINAGWNKIY